MTLGDIRTLMEYTYWATHRILDLCGDLPPEEYTRDLGSSHGGIHGTLAHAMGAEEIWLRRWKGISPSKFYGPGDFPTFESLEDHWEMVEMEVLGFCHMLRSDADLLVPLSYATLRGDRYTQPLVETMQHLANHSTYHRGQVVTMLRQLGRKPVGTTSYSRERQPRTRARGCSCSPSSRLHARGGGPARHTP
jgi:uncharacterized damage-inducible protein DinB